MSSDNSSEIKVKKKKLTDAEKRKRKAEKRRKRLLARGNAGFDYIHNHVSKDELKETEQKNMKNVEETLKNLDNIDSNNINDLNMNTKSVTDMNGNNGNNGNNIFDALGNMDSMGMGLNGMNGIPGMPGFPGINGMPGMNGMNGMPGMNGFDMNNMDDMSGFMSKMMNNMFSGMAGMDNESMKLNKEKNEKIKILNEYEIITHHLFVILFLILYIISPNITLFGYDFKMDTFMYFIGFEIIIFTSFYIYRNNRLKKYNNINSNNGNNIFGIPMIDQMLSQSIFGNIIKQLKMITTFISMIKQITSDLCWIIFLWIIITFLHSQIFKSLISF